MAALMPPDIQRQAYALILVLQDGDHEARLPLSDLFEEHSMPRVNGYTADRVRDAAITQLRMPLPEVLTASTRVLLFDGAHEMESVGTEKHNVGDVTVDQIWLGSYYQCVYFGPRYRV
jgi:hypothetical protein